VATQTFRSRPHAKVPDGVVEEIRAQILAGTLKDGDRLPTVEGLARQFRVSRASVREALQALTTLGLVEVRHGRGTFVHADGDTPDGFTGWIKEQRYALQELCELRVAVETTAAHLAAVKASDDDLDALARTLVQMRGGADDLRAVVHFDTLFHHRITRASRNRLLEQAMTKTHHLLAEVRHRTLALPGEVGRAAQAHEQILTALRNRDAPGAGRAMREHLRAVEQDLGILLP
jgi:GntR family transcriptional repressor for pyruvate dehydrogenase complex